MQRNKGAQAEREIAGILHDLLGGEPIQRRLSQTRDGGYDLQVAGCIAVEVKRVETLSLPAALRQVAAAVEADQEVDVGVVVHRRSRQPWTVSMTVEDFAYLVREGFCR